MIKKHYRWGIFLFVFLLVTNLRAQDSSTFNETSRLAALAKVWGFLKYYHPVVARGWLDWDEIVQPYIARAQTTSTREEFNDDLNDLISRAGNINFLHYPRSLPKNLHNDPLFEWMHDSTHFTWNTIFKLETLLEIHNSPLVLYGDSAKPYVSYIYKRYNLEFYNENAYYVADYPGEALRIVTLFRYWNIIHYFFPYKSLIGEDWDDVLVEFIPKFIAAPDMLSYQLTVKELTTRIRDGHASTSSPVLDEFWGVYNPPFEVCYIEGKTVVNRLYTHVPGSFGNLQVGDIVIKADGVPVEELRESKKIYMEGSNEAAVQRNLNFAVLRGPTENLTLTVDRDGSELEVEILRCPMSEWSVPPESGETWTILAGNIGYVNMGLLEKTQVDEVIPALMNTRAIIFDIRNYPKGTFYLVSEYLNPEPRDFVLVSYPDLRYPGQFLYLTDWIGPEEPNPNYYKNKVVLLVNEKTMSHAEFTCMAFQTAPDVTIIGSQTAGADGNVSFFQLPGKIITRFSGLGMYYPDGGDTQRIGIVPDIEVKPTIAGFRAGRDEVLERALAFINEAGETGR